jgi:hypothetical protein
MRLSSMAGRALPRLTPSTSVVLTSAGSCRSYAVQASGAPRFQVFNRQTKWMQKERAGINAQESRQADYLKDEVAIRLSERLLVSITCRHGRVA